MDKGLNIVFLERGQVKTEGEVRVAAESYLDRKGIVAFEANFCNFFTTGVTNFKQGRILANFMQWQYRMPIEDLKSYCRSKSIRIFLSSFDKGGRAELKNSQGHVATYSDNDLEVAVTLALASLEGSFEQRQFAKKDKPYQSYQNKRYFSNQ